jgi:hypothetical protein
MDRRRALAAASAVGVLITCTTVLAIGAHRAAPRAVEATARFSLLDVLAVVTRALAVLGLVALAFLLGPSGRAPERPPRRTVIGPVVLLVMIVVAFALLRRLRPDGIAEALPEAPTPGRPDVLPGGPSPGLLTSSAALLIVIALAATAALVIRAVMRRRLPAPAAMVPDARSVRARAVLSVAELVELVDAEPDPRRAVMLARAGMERLCALVAAPRRDTETTGEHLSRVSRLLGLSARAAGHLEMLSARAHFSDLAITPSMRAEAIEALRTVHRELSDGAPMGSWAEAPARMSG